MDFSRPDTTKLTLGNGKDWIEVRNELSVGEERRYRSRGLGSMTGMGTKSTSEERDVRIEVNWEDLGLARVEAYLVEWSDKRAVTPANIRALKPKDFEEIDRAIQDHIAKMAEERAKNESTASETSTAPLQ